MQSDHRSCESHDELGRQHWPELLEVFADSGEVEGDDVADDHAGMAVAMRGRTRRWTWTRW
jgi:hypothetical protein